MLTTAEGKECKSFLKFAEQNIDNLMKYRENIVWSDETKTRLSK